MYSAQHCFTSFKSAIDQYQLPERFTFPFYYEPHPLCLIAANELQQYLSTQTDWQHNFGLGEDSGPVIGKMFGVLLVRNQNGELGYLSAFSGKLAEQNLLNGFVPPVFDMLAQESFFHVGMQTLNQLTAKLQTAQSNPDIERLTAKLTTLRQQQDTALDAMRAEIIENRKIRKQRRAHAQQLSTNEIAELNIMLGKESVAEKFRLNSLKLEWQQQCDAVKDQLDSLLTEIAAIKAERALQSNSLQQQLFAQYQFLNQAGELKDLNEIFKDSPTQQPPAGAGECAAPKLLQFAFSQGLTPLAMAEFWWGASPKSEIRQHKNFYGSCQGKCQPILSHMLKGIEMDANPLLTNPAAGKSLEIIYQDEVMAIVNKPAEFLSVPGKNVTDSVYARMKAMFPQATGPLIVHRLDMSTSGLMVIALTSEANKSLAKQFIARTVEKRYVAQVAGVVKQQNGEIKLPLRGDIDDRPRQLVCFEHGKHAHTYWQVKQRTESTTLLYLYPHTGRTHQLRVHCAHQDGLALPIIGDDLYGQKSHRLHLHAQQLVLNHPLTYERLSFEVDVDFSQEA
ncbi:RluA family pseudouridine synthase [Shewanella fidelis]|uniref:RluA family pseudouridine synthase n=1 Tax=Shewanella fidelis TaxID=173509 RepID=A0AAW8NI12_9GAMM|nr:RluA family pseudouridine synthase [Shewanella fidelis]MDR8522944.1 RluA family pseudouridine synthase [Shewanella fidelis]MDW4811730.1 RluA family pseudouridine synthase [Shewanella fidelis]MDW4815851.1 RluA family pseudouridine synthase [Shewanella fidelis]MDW4819941.1 RluA family pseudouridine synthase [Shewanella fidelis]MDW4824085.1 RluA family pseudouridine synthase [Shewanella fidelis]